MTYAPFPATRHRRLRANPWIRELVAETRLHVSDLIWPLFVQEGAESTPVASLPNVSRLSISALVEAATQAKSLGIPAIALFPVTPADKKSADGKEALNKDNLICRAIKAVKDAVPEVGIIADVALDPYTTHGHDGIVINGDVANDATVEILAQQAVVLANAGADVVAPSDMMDGRVKAIRHALETSGHTNTLILSYSAKYASSLYGPFRDAVGSSSPSPLGGEGRDEGVVQQTQSERESPLTLTLSPKGRGNYLCKKTYQMSPANADEAMREIASDIAEGADMVMVKPGLPYLDIIHRAATNFHVPVLAYQVSGEYAMAHAMPNAEAILMESLLCLKRAGARAILTYAAPEVAKIL